MSVEGRRAPQGLQAEDKLAFGLSSTHLGYILLTSMGAYALLGMHVSPLLRWPAASLLEAFGAALAWGRIQHRGVDEWAWLWLTFLLRARSGGEDLASRRRGGSVVVELELGRVSRIVCTQARNGYETSASAPGRESADASRR